MSQYVEVLLINRPLHKTYTYCLPIPQQGSRSIVGCKVTVPFQGRLEPGYVLNEPTTCTPKYACKHIKYIFHNELTLNETDIRIANKLSKLYLSPLSETLKLFSPSGKSPIPPSFPDVPPKTLSTLTNEQQKLVEEMKNFILQKRHHIFVLRGDTGTGKTEIYKHLSHIALQSNRQAWIMVPEISMIPQMFEHFASVFGKQNICVSHSKMSYGERLDQRIKIQTGKAMILLGVRGALFFPSKQVGILILDEENDFGYKNSKNPRYHSRQVAQCIAKERSIPLVLGSATPSMESLWASRNNNNTTELRLTQKYSQCPDPKIHVIPIHTSHALISQELEQAITTRLLKNEQVLIFLNRRGYAGTAYCPNCELLQCPNCSVGLTWHRHIESLTCHYCETRIASPHVTDSDFIVCPNCFSTNVKLFLPGTEQIECELQTLFPRATIKRMDRDNLQGANAHETILQDFTTGKTNILVGTKMLTKGLHFPNATLVGILLADQNLQHPDFRATENTRALLTQIIGRVGRAHLPGEVFLQTMMPKHEIFQFTKNASDFNNVFFENELRRRKRLRLPPTTRMIKWTIRGKVPTTTNPSEAFKAEQTVSEKVRIKAQRLHDFLKHNLLDSGLFSYQSLQQFDLKITLPRPSEIIKQQKCIRYKIFMFASPERFPQLLQKLRSLQLQSKFGQNLIPLSTNYHLEIDVDPIDIL